MAIDASPVRLVTTRRVEMVLAALIVVGLVHTLFFIYFNGYIPPPYFYDPLDTWMDWFNTAWWAHDPGTYDNWQAIYPPLSFVFLRIFGIARCYVELDSLGARDCDWLGVVAFHSFYVLNIFIIAHSYLRIDRSTALPRSIALTTGLPMTIGLDRGNLILICFTCFALAYGPLVRSARVRWMAAGLAVNFKVYLIASIFPQLIRRRWLWFEGAIIATITVYISTYAALGRGALLEILGNIRQFSDVPSTYSFLDAWNAGTYSPMVAMLSGSDSPIMAILGSERIELGMLVLPLALHIVQATIILAVVGAWLRPEAVTMYRLTNLGTCFALISVEPGAYTQVLFIFLTFMEQWKGYGRSWALLICYILCLPIDFVMHYLEPGVRESFFAGRPVIVDYAVTYGPFIRPGLIMSVPFALACVTIREVWVDITLQGWRGRRRFYRDFPLLLAGGGARQTSGSDAA